MAGTRFLRAIVLTVVCGGLAWPVVAQDDSDERVSGYNAIIDNIDLLVDNYARFLARKYDLTEDQDAYTKVLLRDRSYEFLDKHETQLRGLVDRMFEVRSGGEMTQDELVEWGKQVRPIYDDAKRLVIGGNDDWREILTPEQQKIHDEDVRLMTQSFATTEDQLDRIVSGEMTVEEFRSPQRGNRRAARTPKAKPTPPPPSERTEKPRPTPPVPDARVTNTPREEDHGKLRPTPRGTTRAPRTASKPEPRVSRQPASSAKRTPTRSSGKKSESEWEKYVREFIVKYQLNDEQTQKANAVLEDCQAQADRYLKSQESQIARIDKQLDELKKSKDKNKSKNVAKLTEQRNRLKEPVQRIFDQQLKPRLERLPTRAQRRAAEEAASKKTSGKKTSSKGKTPSKKP